MSTPQEIVSELEALERELETYELERSLKAFIPLAWKWVEPAGFVPNWHIDAIADHLEGVTSGDIKYLLITMPPRHSKSLVVSVLWPCWEWLKYPQYRWVFASYAFNLTVRDSIKRRNLIQTKWYQERWSRTFQLVKEQNSKVRFENDKRGFMLASSVGGSNTGEGGERIVADDPHNVKKAESEDVRTDTVDWWNITMSTRRNDEVISARVVVQQRVHEGDVAGDIMEKGGVVHLNLPAEFEADRRCFTSFGGKTWSDPRTFEGELLNPQRFGPAKIEESKLNLGDYQYAAQFQQNPTPPKGNIIQAQWLKYYGGPTGIAIPEWPKSTNPFCPLLSLDCTFKEHKDTDYVAGLGWAMFGSDIYLMPINIHSRLSFTGTIDALAGYVGGKSLDGSEHPGIYPYIKIKLIEDKANGSAIIDTMRHQIPGLVAYQPGGASKESRLQACSWRFRAGNVYLPHESIAPWIKEYVYELCAFPKARRDDYADSTSQALLWLGGDTPVEGMPEAGQHESTWIGVGENNLLNEGTSLWGPITGFAKSIWKRN